MKTAGIYIHIPFCKNKCNYCDYYCLEKRGHDMEVFIKMLQREIELTADSHDKDWLFDTIYFGGGSPALLSPKELDSILDLVKNKFNTAKHMEVTIEVNPGETIEDELLSFKDSGVNRLSIGFQSLDPSLLNILSRTHNPEDCFIIFNDAREACFDNISIDMLYSIPKQSVEIWMKNLKIVSNLRPDHIAVYPLIIEEGTPLYLNVKSGEILSAHKEIELKMFKWGSQFLSENGFMQYEVAHFAKTGKKSKHNQHYWNRDPNLAFGPSAHGYDKIKRWWNVSSLDDYLNKLSRNEKPIGGFEKLHVNQRLNEEIIWGLRTTNGIKPDLLQDSKLIVPLESSLTKWKDYLDISNDTIRIKPGYYHLADDIVLEFLISD